MPAARRERCAGPCDDYRAGAGDVAQDEIDAHVKIACSTLALWGQQSPAIVGLFDMEAIWNDMAADLHTVTTPQCGHLPPEEQTEAVSRALLDFLSDWKG